MNNFKVKEQLRIWLRITRDVYLEFCLSKTDQNLSTENLQSAILLYVKLYVKSSMYTPFRAIIS